MLLVGPQQTSECDRSLYCGCRPVGRPIFIESPPFQRLMYLNSSVVGVNEFIGSHIAVL